MKHIAYLLCLSASSHTALFPADYLCDNGDKVRLSMQGAEQRLVYASEKYGTHNGTLDVFRGEGEHKREVTGSVFSLDPNTERPVALSMQVKTVGNVVQEVTYNYRLYPNTEESGKCIPIKNGLIISGGQSYQ